MIASTDTILLSLLTLLLALAVRTDLLERRIPNALVGCAIAASLFVHATHSGWQGVLHGACGAAAGIAAMLPFYLLRGMGAGDVKLMGAVGSVMGPLMVLLAAAWTLIAGTVLALSLVTSRVMKKPNSHAIAALCSASLWRLTFSQMRGERFPYAMAIAAGALIALWQQDRLMALSLLR
jgi:prepilin peptidase CpaA